MPEIFVGSVSVGVVPDARNFHNKLRADLVPSSGRIGREMGQNITQGVVQNLDMGRAGDQGAGDFASSFKKRMEAALKSLPKIDINADSTDADKKLAEIRVQMEALSDKTIGVDISSAQAMIDMEMLEQELKKVAGQNVDVSVRADTTRAVAQLVAFRREVEALDSGPIDRMTNSIHRMTGNTSMMHLSLFGKIWAAIGISTSFLEPILAGITVSVLGLGAGLVTAMAGAGAYGLVILNVMAQYKKLKELEKAAGTAKGQAALEAYVKGLSPAFQAFDKQLDHTKMMYRRWASDLEAPVLGPITKALGIVAPALKSLSPLVRASASAFGILVGELKKNIEGGGLTRFVQVILPHVIPSILNFAHTIGNVISGIWGLLRAFLPVSDQMSGGLERLTERFKKWGQSMGPSHSGFRALMKMFREQGPIAIDALKNIAGILKNFGGAMVGLTGFGNSGLFLLFLRDFSGVLKQISDNPWLMRIILYILAFRSGLGKMVSVLGPSVMGMMNLSKGFLSAESAAASSTGMLGTIGGKLKDLVSWFGKTALGQKIVTAGQWLWNAAMDANPIMLVVLAIIALVAIFVILWNKSEAFRNFWKAAWEIIKNVAKAVWEDLKKTWNNFIDSIKAKFEAVRNFLKGAWAVINTVWRAVWDALKAAWNREVEGIKIIFSAVRDFLKGAWGVIVSAWHAVWDGLSGAWDRFIGRIRSVFTTLRDWLKTVWNSVRDAWKNVWDAIKGVITSPVKWVVQHVWNPFANMVNRFTSFLHMGKPVPTLDASGWQKGGRIPGYGGGDIVPAHIQGVGPALLEPGEAIVPKQHAKDPDFAAWAGRKGIPGYQFGGILGGIESVGGWITDQLKDLVAGALQATARPVIHSLISLLGHAPGMSSGWTQTLIKLPETVLDKFLDWLGKMDEKFGGDGGAIAKFAETFLGRIPYVWGGTNLGPGGADCSGFVYSIYRHFGISPPRTSESQSAWAKHTKIPTTGGLAFYDSPAGGAPPGHVAIIKNAKTVISQGGGMGPNLESLRYMTLLGMGIPPGGFGKSGGKADYKENQIASLWQQAGGAHVRAHLMSAIAMAESGGRAGAHNASGATGLWQVMPSSQMVPGSLYNPLINARNAVAIFRSQGLNAWDTYKSGAYARYMDSGGWMMPGTGGFNATDSPEPVFTGTQWNAISALASVGARLTPASAAGSTATLGQILNELKKLNQTSDTAPARTAAGVARAVNGPDQLRAQNARLGAR